jgi:very-short-patch-repair endonuclease
MANKKPSNRRHRVKPQIMAYAHELRAEATPAEMKLWFRLREFRYLGYFFRRQHPMYDYIVDFYCPRCRLVVEIDGDSHAEQEHYDKQRTHFLQIRGYRVIRFTNREVENELEAVLESILAACKEDDHCRRPDGSFI